MKEEKEETIIAPKKTWVEPKIEMLHIDGSTNALNDGRAGGIS
ncbi:hypothetical protein [Lacihabitans lacunae]|uniref:Paeninodin family lasso peptide n=1 Tax=Lacihabitans lacunae TaxID=1028214 RepID=A0ABV7YZB3_9BACT